jgi:hypothetical protein
MCIAGRIFGCFVLVCSLVGAQLQMADSGMLDGDQDVIDASMVFVDTKQMLLKSIFLAFENKNKVLLLCELESCVYSKVAKKYINNEMKNNYRLDKYTVIRVGNKKSRICQSVVSTTSFPALYSVNRNFRARRLKFNPDQELHLDIFEDGQEFHDLRVEPSFFATNVARLMTVLHRYRILFEDHQVLCIISLGILFLAFASLWWMVNWLIDLLLPLPQPKLSDLTFEDSGFSG